MPSVLHLKENITKFPRFQYTKILYFDFQHDPIFRVRVERENNLRGRCLDSLWCCMRYWLTGERIYNPKKISVFLGLDQVTVIRSTVDKNTLASSVQKPALLLHNNYRLPKLLSNDRIDLLIS